MNKLFEDMGFEMKLHPTLNVEVPMDYFENYIIMDEETQKYKLMDDTGDYYPWDEYVENLFEEGYLESFEESKDLFCDKDHNQRLSDKLERQRIIDEIKVFLIKENKYSGEVVK